ncbi:MAG TPA: sporulation histidine kinase inhibitor Sda [Bacillus bacterium]|nr:sporulation histidine kinase inhibitor Sda [Bacillus sp. (in: firmicutes)]
MITLKTLDDALLLTAYEKAVNLNLSAEFLGILESEISNRGLVIIS